MRRVLAIVSFVLAGALVPNIAAAQQAQKAEDPPTFQPEPFFGRMKIAGPFVAKWLAYIDKFLLFPRREEGECPPAARIRIDDH